MEVLDKQNAENLLSELNVTVAGSGLMDEESYKKYVNALMEQAQLNVDDNSDEFDKDGLTMLRQKLGK